MEIADLVGAAFLPTDGQASPSDITQSLAKGARTARRASSSRIARSPASTIEGRPRHRRGDRPRATIACEMVVNCAGQWAREIGRLAGVYVPLQSVQAPVLITEKIAGVPRDLPTLRDPDRRTYFKEEVGGLVMGGYEPNPIAWATGEHSRGLRVPAARRRLGSFRAA